MVFFSRLLQSRYPSCSFAPIGSYMYLPCLIVRSYATDGQHSASILLRLSSLPDTISILPCVAMQAGVSVTV